MQMIKQLHKLNNNIFSIFDIVKEEPENNGFFSGLDDKFKNRKGFNLLIIIGMSYSIELDEKGDDSCYLKK